MADQIAIYSGWRNQSCIRILYRSGGIKNSKDMSLTNRIHVQLQTQHLHKYTTQEAIQMLTFEVPVWIFLYAFRFLVITELLHKSLGMVQFQSY